MKDFAAVEPNSDVLSNPFTSSAHVMHDKVRACHADSYVLSGTLLLYLVGRFEYYIKTIFEDLCIRIATRAGSFYKLPRDMQDNLVKFTAEVMKDPRKYGHAENGVKAFVVTLAANLNEDQDIVRINSACLSITYENMRARTLSELFERIGIKDIWRKIGQQAKVQAFFETGDAEEARKKAENALNSYVDLRNQIAHPTANLSWPDTSKVNECAEFLHVLSLAVADLISVYEVQVTSSHQ